MLSKKYGEKLKNIDKASYSVYKYNKIKQI